MGLYLVTGGAGFIGSSIARALIARGDGVRILDNFSTGKRENIADIAQRIELLEGDIRDDRVLARATGGVEVVFHEAAIASVPQSMAEPLENHAVNATGTMRVLEAARHAGVRRVVYAASSAAYGDDPGLPKVETMRPAPISPYGATKLAGEVAMQVYAARVRPGDRLPPLLQCLRPAAGSEVGVRGRDPEVHHRGARGQAAAHLR
jgi:UDP-glucose 4-epimerase